MSKELDCNDPEFFRVLQLAMQTYALSITAGFCINEKELAIKERPPVRLPEDDLLELSIGEEAVSEAKMRRLVKEAKREKRTTA